MEISLSDNPLKEESAKIAAIRSELPAALNYTYLNAGTNGPLPRRTHEAIMAYATNELEQGRIRFESFMQLLDEKKNSRQQVAHLLGCELNEVALTHNTTEGMNIALMGLNWQPGDEAITATTEHPGGLYPLYLLKQRYGIKIRQTNIGHKDCDPLDELRKAITPRTKAIVLSHVCWSTGMVLPLREISELAHLHNILVICDAAQSCGMIPTKVYDLGVDAYAISGQKWLCGPDSTGALFIRKDRLGDIWQTFVGYESFETSNYEGYVVPPPGANRYHGITTYPPAVRAWRTSLEWLADDIGWDWIYARIARLGQYCYEQLAAIPGTIVFTPKESMAGLVSFKIEGLPADDLATALTKHKILLRSIPQLQYVRVSTGFYNTAEEIDRLVEILKSYQADPARLAEDLK